MINKTEKKILIDFLQHNLIVNRSYDSSIFILKQTFESFSILNDILLAIKDKKQYLTIDSDDTEILKYNIKQLENIIKLYNNKKYTKEAETALNNLNSIKENFL